MATKPSVRIPRWATDHAPQPTGTGNTPQGTNPKIEPSPALIASGFTGPPSSPPYEIINELFGSAGELLDFFNKLVDANGAYTGDSSHGRFTPSTDTLALVRFALENVNGGANVSELAADRLATIVDNRLEAVAAGRLKHTAAAAERRFEADGLAPLLETPAASAFSKRSEGLYLHNLIKAKAILTIGGGSGAYTVDVLDPGAGDLAYNVSSAAIDGAGVITINFNDSLDLGTFRQLFIQVFSNGAGGTIVAEQLTPISSASSAKFRLKYQDAAGGAWTVITSSTATASLTGTFINVMVI